MKQDVRLTQVLSPNRIRTHVRATSKEEALRILAELIAQDNNVAAEEVLEKIVEREKLMSTGIGKGFACPHAKFDALPANQAALITLEEPIEFDSLDQQPVNIVLMLVGPTSAVGEHLRLLSRISRLMVAQEVRDRILQSQTPEEVLAILRQEEERRIETQQKEASKNE